MKKAQIEMMGLVVIVIIIAVAFLFLFYYLSGPGKQSSQLKQTYQQELLAYNTIGSVLQATTECRNLDIADLLDDCISGFNSITCWQNGPDSCTYSKAQTEIILKQIFEKNNVQYYFFVLDSAKNIKMDIGTECTGSRTSATQPLPSRSGELVVGIDICG